MNEPMPGAQMPEQGELVLARIHGAPMLQLPADLYIPPDALEVFLETFEGPLDLLLYLIRRSYLDILDIPMAPLTGQYLVYVEAMRSGNLDLASDYLLMAATLLDIKSRMLLPRPPREDAADHEADPRAELVRRLIEYERVKRGARLLDSLPRAERDFEWVVVHVAEKTVERLPELSLGDLQEAWLALVQRARLHRNHQIRREELSVREHMSLILRRLQGQGEVAFEDLFDLAHGVSSLIVGFLAMLELVKERLVRVMQSAPMEAIHVRLNDPATPGAA